ncbi:MAG: hypothetical protein M3Q97_07810, partial [Bacteroidota bacterium]|nr:hypothetical protein [Bacteroidota bacterium]
PVSKEYRLFGKCFDSPCQLIIHTIQPFENDIAGWSEAHNVIPVPGENDFAQSLASGAFSSAFTFNLSGLDSSLQENLLVSVGCSIYSASDFEGKLVITVEVAEKPVYWESVNLMDFIDMQDRWETAFIKRKLPVDLPGDAVLKAYVWNTGKEPFLIDELGVKVNACSGMPK